VVQLQLLDLMIDKRDVGMPMDANMRLELIDLMASILVWVFEAQEGRVMYESGAGMRNSPITSGGQSRLYALEEGIASSSGMRAGHLSQLLPIIPSTRPRTDALLGYLRNLSQTSSGHPRFAW